MARLIYSDYESNRIAPVIAIDLERHLYSQYSFLYEIGGLSTILSLHIQRIRIQKALISLAKKITVQAVRGD